MPSIVVLITSPSPRKRRLSRRLSFLACRIDKRGAAVHVGESESQASPGLSEASQGIDAEIQCVNGSCWSLRCRCRGGVTNVA